LRTFDNSEEINYSRLVKSEFREKVPFAGIESIETKQNKKEIFKNI